MTQNIVHKKLDTFEVGNSKIRKQKNIGKTNSVERFDQPFKFEKTDEL